MKFKFTNHSAKNLLIFALSCVVFALAFLFLLSVRSLYIQEKEVLDESHFEFSQKLKKRDSLLQLIANKNLRDKIDKVNNFAIDSNQTLVFLSFIENKIQAFGLDGQIVSAKLQKTDKKRFGVLRLQIHAKGREANILDFIEAIQNLPYILKLDSARLSSEGNMQILDLSISFYTINNDK